MGRSKKIALNQIVSEETVLPKLEDEIIPTEETSINGDDEIIEEEIIEEPIEEEIIEEPIEEEIIEEEVIEEEVKPRSIESLTHKEYRFYKMTGIIPK